jgi:hypothetical protein
MTSTPSFRGPAPLPGERGRVFSRPTTLGTMLMPRAPEPAPEPVVPLFVYADPRDLDIRDPQVFAAMVAACRREARVREWPMVVALLAARWRFELPGGPDAATAREPGAALPEHRAGVRGVDTADAPGLTDAPAPPAG